MLIRQRLSHYVCLMRLDKPIGILLLLWPTLWALWLASKGQPNSKILIIFVAGVILMRSTGCIINDFADRHLDGHVQRTRQRPLASGKINSYEALLLALLLCLFAFLLVLQCNLLTIKFAFIGAALAIVYPFLKRVTYLPQLGLGMAFAWGIPMAFAAEMGIVNFSVWFLFFTGIIWPIIYDTMYAMVDREDDIKIGIKSTAILFASMDRAIIGLLQGLFVVLLGVVGLIFELHSVYYAGVVVVGVLFIYQQWLIKHRETQQCFKAFLNNHWVGFVIFVGIVLSYL
ncbi:MAG: 4-hydroxybenzoate octaprenyltransferase [Gammaproteobacteria bacterium]|nr:4-hydroxybenzoate octaprenyltransferase [Gammaproteobacteria bacterium]MCW5583672.1 4-hydroxybenzoate octaprenyltransferase [Gammaproteobacteria bacterium]